VADLLKLVLVAGPLIKTSRLTGTRNVAAMISFTAASATSIRTMLPHPLRRFPMPVHR
jgi:hypothetical protein